MNCDEKQETLYRLADGELPATEVDRLKAHLKACRKCQRLYDRLILENQNLIRALTVEPLTGNEVRRLEKRLLRQLAPPFYRMLYERLALGFYPTVAGLTAGLLMWLFRMNTGPIYSAISRELLESSDFHTKVLNLALAVLMTFAMVYVHKILGSLEPLKSGGE